MASVRVVVDRAAVRRELYGPSGGVARDMMRRGRRVENQAKRLCPVDKGQLRGSITTELVEQNGTIEVRVGTNVAHAVWVHEGTGIYAGRGYIYPRTSAFLSWQADGGRVFARRVRGQRGVPFLRNALPAARA